MINETIDINVMTTSEKFKNLGVDKFISMNADDLAFVSSDSSSKDIEAARVYQVTDNERMQILEIAWSDGSENAFVKKVRQYIIFDREIDDYARMKDFKDRLELIYDSAAM